MPGVIASWGERLGLGFANWAYEVADQEEQLGVFFDTIVVCSVTGSTQAGMAALIDLVDRGEIPRDSTMLYAHLGGQPALNGYSALFS